MPQLRASLLLLVTSLAAAACGKHEAAPTPPPSAGAEALNSIDQARAQIDTAGLLGHIRTLSSDAFEGRLPGTAGETRTVEYLSRQFEKMGLAPGNPDGSYVQKVPLVGIQGKATFKLSVGGKTIEMQPNRDFVAATTRFVPEVKVDDSELVFVGYGIQAPEYDWDDYKGLDVKGKTLVMLINDPPIARADDPEHLDEAMFKGRAMTYYGRWTYKFEIASKLGAAGAIIVHETEPAAYPWAVVESSWGGEQFSLANPDQNMSRVPVQSWITADKARELFTAAGQDFDELKRQSLKREFAPVALPAKASFAIKNKIRQVQSQNVIARITGSDPELADEYVIYTAHWDHLGKDTALQGDQIYNGAVDNASGTAAVLEIAQAFQSLPVKPRRSLLFLAVTAEEQGLLGSQFYAENPLYPLQRTVATINIDAMNVWGRTRELQVIGMGQNTLEDDLAKVLERYGRVTVADEHPEKGSYFRSDQFNFAKQGVPSLYADDGTDVIGKPGYGEQKRQAYTATDYHKPSDEIHSDWDLSGTVADTQALFDLGDKVANDAIWPTWKPGSEFKAKREESLRAAGR